MSDQLKTTTLENFAESGNTIPDKQPKMLTIDQISDIRRPRKDPSLFQYGTNKVDAQVEFQVFADSFKDKNHFDQYVAIGREKQPGEAFGYEQLIISALLEQQNIARRFGIPAERMGNGLYIQAGSPDSTRITDSTLRLFLLPLRNHINTLRRKGATDEQLVTELAGHIFHEALHTEEADEYEPIITEVTPVTGQLAYYLDQEYKGPNSYDRLKLEAGIRKIQEGQTSDLDYDIATCIGTKVINEALQEAFPEVAQTVVANNMLEANQRIVSELSAEQKQTQLIPALKKAITRSALRENHNRVFEELSKANTKVMAPITS